MVQGRSDARKLLRARAQELEERDRLFPLEETADKGVDFESAVIPVAAEFLTGRGRREVLFAEGDSWFDYPLHDVLSVLEDDYRYDVVDVATAGDRVEDMAYSTQQRRRHIRTLERMERRGQIPKAILLSGGGNDIAGDEFHMMLNHRSSASHGLNEQVAAGVIDQRLMESYAALIGWLSELCKRKFGRQIPVLVHGYDHGVPDGRGFASGWGPLPGPWLRPGFDRKGYENEREMKAIVKSLINRFNDSLEALAQAGAFAGVVHYVDLRDTLKRGPTTYKDWWANELHPTKRGFKKVAKEFQAVLEAL